MPHQGSDFRRKGLEMEREEYVRRRASDRLCEGVFARGFHWNPWCGTDFDLPYFLRPDNEEPGALAVRLTVKKAHDIHLQDRPNSPLIPEVFVSLQNYFPNVIKAFARM